MPDELAVQDGSKHTYSDFQYLNSSRIVSVSNFRRPIYYLCDDLSAFGSSMSGCQRGHHSGHRRIFTRCR